MGIKRYLMEIERYLVVLKEILRESNEIFIFTRNLLVYLLGIY